jgi:hypothetical protein
MADTSGMNEIRGIDIDKLAKGFADIEPNILKKFVTNSKTKAREIRWYQKTAGFLTTTTTSGITLSQMQTDQLALPTIVEQSWTRQTSYVKKFFLQSPTFSMEDIKDSDPDVLATNVRDIVRGVERQVGLRIYFMLTNCAPATPTTPLTDTSTYGAVQTTAATDGWDQTATMDPVLDILNGKQKLMSYGYNPEGSILGMNSIEHKYLITYLINVKGSSIPSFSSEKVRSGVVMELLGCNVVVDEIFTTDYVIQWVPDRAVTWKQFMPITTAVIDDAGIGKRVRVWEEGEALITDVNAVHVISDTIG